MSAKRKRHSAVILTKDQEASEFDYSFSLEQDESLGFIFNEGQIRMDPEDHLENLFQSSIEVEDILKVKKEPVDVDYFCYSRSPAAEPSLNDYYRSIKELQNKCRLVQQIILATATEGFRARQEEQGQAKGEPQIGSCITQPYGQFDPKHSLTSNIIEEQPYLKIEESREEQRQNGTVTVMTVLDTKNSLSATQQSIQFASNCCYNPPTSQEKLYFLQLLYKLQFLSRGIERKMIATYEKDHRCKVCGLQFQTGRKLGGHISRKHPGNSYDYLMKKEIRKSKLCERNRRKYLKNLQFEKSLNRKQKQLSA